MLKYPMTNRDAMRSVMARVPTAGVKFVDPVLNMFFEDERNGLCDIAVKRLPPTVVDDNQQHEVHVSYYDPELEFVKRMSI